MAIYTYCRVSLGLQVEEGNSLKTQQRQVRGYAQMHGFAVATHFVETSVSGLVAMGDRPEGQRLLTVLQPGDAVITPKLDRMFRLARDALDTMTELREKGVALHIIDLGGDFIANGTAKPIFTSLAAVAGPEQRRAQKRIVKPQRAPRHRGRAPFGFALLEDGTLAEAPVEQDAIRRLLEYRAQGRCFHEMFGFMMGLGFRMSDGRLRDLLARYPDGESTAEPEAAPTPKRRAHRPAPNGAPWIHRRTGR